MLRALARVDLAAIERNCARLAGAMTHFATADDDYEITCAISARVPRRHVRGGAGA